MKRQNSGWGRATEQPDRPLRDKRAPIGICDLCGDLIPRDEWYTSKGRERLYCSTTCKATANSRAGAPIRSRKAKERVARGEWINPRARMTGEEISRVQSRASRAARLREVREGHWRNPAVDDRARRKLSRPRKHRGALHRAIEKLRLGSMDSLTDAERRAWTKYRRGLRQARLDEIRQHDRERYRLRQARLTPDEREEQRVRWREQNKRRKKRPRKRVPK